MLASARKETGNLNSSKTSPMKKALVAGVAVVSMVAGTAGPAAANAPGAGTFVGHEHVYEEAVLTNPATFCTKFAAGTQHHLEMQGTFHGTVGVGTATYTASQDYYANPEGTYSDPNCTVPTDLAGVPGTMTIEFGPPLEPPVWTCSGSATFTRRATSVYTLEFTGSCNNTVTANDEDYGTDVTFTGAMEACAPVGCPVVHPDGSTEDAQALMEGEYVQTDRSNDS